MTAPINQGYLWRWRPRQRLRALAVVGALAKYSRLISHPTRASTPRRTRRSSPAAPTATASRAAPRARVRPRPARAPAGRARLLEVWAPLCSAAARARSQAARRSPTACSAPRDAALVRRRADAAAARRQADRARPSYDDGSPPSARDTASCPEDSVTYWASECPGDAMAQCDAARLNTAETAADDDPYAGVLDIGATGPLTELAKIGRLFRGGVAEDGTRWCRRRRCASRCSRWARASRTATASSTARATRGASGEYRMRDFCAGDCWGLGACFKARRPAPPHAPPRDASPSSARVLPGGGGKGAAGDAVVLARGAVPVGQVGRAGGGAGAVAALVGGGRLVRDRAPVEFTAPGPPTPRRMALTRPGPCTQGTRRTTCSTSSRATT